ncbi:YeeE/YedE family protein [Massilia atriviolacea]|uniref:YeeE/YedE family protein n=2 Tax=Massilia atriviolacea TaxID=2495579 RepID=A0A430HMC0_9BURK|nr:YeeE/YedE family protein [Massilia atriviolacea]
MKHTMTAFASGLVFGLGLILSGMTDPSRVIGFLDLAGNFDPALAFVMGGAIPVAAIAFRIAARRRATPLAPATGKIDTPLLLGALTFGAGWGVAGYCPGPALASLLTGGADAGIFVAAMLGGMLLFELAQSVRKRRQGR